MFTVRVALISVLVSLAALLSVDSTALSENKCCMLRRQISEQRVSLVSRRNFIVKFRMLYYGRLSRFILLYIDFDGSRLIGNIK